LKSSQDNSRLKYLSSGSSTPPDAAVTSVAAGGADGMVEAPWAAASPVTVVAVTAVVVLAEAFARSVTIAIVPDQRGFTSRQTDAGE
jgi:hypothetical protein